MDVINSHKSLSHRVGIVAGWGNFPVEVARHLLSRGHEVYVAALKDHAYPELAEIATHCRWFGALKLGAQLRYFAQNEVQEVALAGKIFKNKILNQKRGWVGHAPDWTCIRVLGGSFITHRRDGRDDTLLHAITDEFERRGITVLTIQDAAPHLLVDDGCLTRKKPAKATLRDVQFGWQIARQMGALDVGQSVTVKDQLILGVEAIEGTDALVTRTGKMCPRGGFVLVKVAKPNQDMRFDVPTIGAQTVRRVAEAGGTAIAIEAGHTLLVDREETIAEANRLGITLFAMTDAAVCRSVATPSSSSSQLIRPAA